MTAAEFKALRQSLGLTQIQLAKILGYATRERVAGIELETRTARQVPALLGRLMRAYEAGYRPPDWPKQQSTEIR